MPAEWPQGLDRLHLDETDTTNAEAARRAAFGHWQGWILADFQTAGRGRRGRAWVSPRGNFHASLLMRPEGPPSDVALRSFVAALALQEALGQITGVPQAFTLKWPNDVLLNGQKCCGILLEAVSAKGGVSHLVVGIGVNLIAAPDPSLLEARAVPPVSILQELGVRIPPSRLLDALAPAFARYEAILLEQGFAPLRAAWLAHAARLGEQITARIGDQEHVGIFETIDETGALVLRQPSGTRMLIPAADIYF